VTPEDASAHFLGLGPVRSVAELPGGHIHRSWRVDAEGGRFVVQRCNTTVFTDLDAVMENMTLVCAAVDPSLSPIPVHEGGWLWRDGGEVWRALPWIADTVSPTPADAEELGRGLGAFHRATEAIDAGRLHITIPQFHDPPARYAALEKLLSGACALAAQLASLEWCASGLSDLPTRVAHFDAKAANFLLDRSTRRVRALIDLDTVMPGSWLWDVGDLARSAAATTAEDEPGDFDLAIWNTLRDGYLSVVSDRLTPRERSQLAMAPLVVTWEQAVRFLTDHLAGDVYYRVDYRGHNQVRAAAQVALLESMAGAL
jgi:N-acetylhexosamine 1-kinase